MNFHYFAFLCAIFVGVNSCSPMRKIRNRKYDFQINAFCEDCEWGELVTPTSGTHDNFRCWYFKNHNQSDCLDVSRISATGLKAVLLGGWDKLTLFSSKDCTGESEIILRESCEPLQCKRCPALTVIGSVAGPSFDPTKHVHCQPANKLPTSTVTNPPADMTSSSNATTAPNHIVNDWRNLTSGSAPIPQTKPQNVTGSWRD